MARMVSRWWSGGRGAMKSAEIDLRVGGGWRFVMVSGDGAEVVFRGRYRKIVPGERLVYTELFDLTGLTVATARLHKRSIPRPIVSGVELRLRRGPVLASRDQRSGRACAWARSFV